MSSHKSIDDARSYLSRLPARTDITAIIALSGNPDHPLFEDQKVFRREQSEVTPEGRTLSAFYFGFAPPPARGPRTYYMSCTKENLYDALGDERVASVFECLNVAFYVTPGMRERVQ